MDKRKEALQTGERLKRAIQGILSAFLCVAMALSFTFFVLPEKKVNAETTDDIAKQIRITVENKHDKINQKVNPEQWGDDVYIYWWYKNGTEAKGPEWPGVKMALAGTTTEGHRVYQYSIVPEGVLGGILLDDGTGESGIHQTVDISISPEGDTTGILAWLKYGTTEANITNSGLYVIYHPFTYDDSIKLPSTVKTEPTAQTLTENGAAQALVNAGQTEDGTMNYAIGKDASTAPTEGWSIEIPTGKDAGTYYVWYKVVGDGIHRDSEAKSVTVTISAKSIPGTTGEGVDEMQNTPSVSEVTAPEIVTISKPKNNKKKTATISWKKTKADGYEVQIALKKDFKKGDQTKTTKKTSAQFKKLKKGKTYYVRVRAYNLDGDKKVYSQKWSAVKKIKIKK